jgi:hypothetical protein
VVLPEQEVVIKAKEYKIIPYEVVRHYAQRLHSGLEADLMQYLTEER